MINPRMSKMLAFRIVFASADVVTCECGRVLKDKEREPRNLLRLVRLGCPVCQSRVWNYTMPDNLAPHVVELMGEMAGGTA